MHFYQMCDILVKMASMHLLSNFIDVNYVWSLIRVRIDAQTHQVSQLKKDKHNKGQSPKERCQGKTKSM